MSYDLSGVTHSSYPCRFSSRWLVTSPGSFSLIGSLIYNRRGTVIPRINDLEAGNCSNDEAKGNFIVFLYELRVVTASGTVHVGFVIFLYKCFPIIFRVLELWILVSCNFIKSLKLVPVSEIVHVGSVWFCECFLHSSYLSCSTLRLLASNNFVNYPSQGGYRVWNCACWLRVIL